MLNFLIAIISQSYEEVMSKAEIFKYKTRVDLNLECQQIFDFIGFLESFNTLLIVSQDEDVQSEQWQGVVNSIKTFIRSSFKIMRESA